MIQKIRNIFKNRESHMSGNFKKYAVVILLFEDQGKTNILFEVRSFKLKHQPGDICLPGGMVEKNETPREASIREAIEELNLTKDDIEFIGDMDYVVTPYGFIMYPFIAKLNSKISNYNVDEVDHIFSVPIEFFVENKPELHELTLVPHLKSDFPYNLINNGINYKFRRGKVPEYFYLYKNYTIWGFTALVLKNFIDIIVSTN